MIRSPINIYFCAVFFLPIDVSISIYSVLVLIVELE